MPTEEPNTDKGFYLCTAGHMHQAFRMIVLDWPHAESWSRCWSDGTRVLESFGLDPAFHEAFERAWAAVDAQAGVVDNHDPPRHEEARLLFNEHMTVSGYGDVLDDPEKD